MSVFNITKVGADLVIERDGVQSITRHSLLNLQINVNLLSNIVIFPNATIVNFNTDTVTGYLDAESLGNQIGQWVELANNGQ